MTPSERRRNCEGPRQARKGRLAKFGFGTSLLAILFVSSTAVGQTSLQAVAKASPTAGPAPLTVTFIGQGTDPTASITRYRWDFQGDGIFDTSDPASINHTFTFTRIGTYTAVLEVTNSRNEIATATVTITVTSSPPTAVVRASPSNGGAPLTVQFGGTWGDPDGAIVLYEWDFNGDGKIDYSSKASGSTSFTYSQQGVYTATLRVTDNNGLTATAQTTVRVGAAGSPTASITAPSAAQAVSPPATLNFNGTGTAATGNKIVLYEWDFNGDGTYDYSSAAPAATSYTYTSAGLFNAAFRVTDDQGRTGIDILPISVSFTPTVKISDNTLRPRQNGTVNIQSTLAGSMSVALLIQNRQHQTVRTIVGSQTRAAGSYTDSWDGTDDSGAVVPEGEYYVVLQYAVNGVTRTVDPSASTGGISFGPSNPVISTTKGGPCTSCVLQPFNNNFLQLDFDLNSAAEVTTSMRLLSSLVELAPIFERKPIGEGHSTVVWSGTDATGQIVTSPPGDNLIFALEAFTLPDNAIFAEDAPQLTNVTVSPNYFDPSTPDFVSPQGPAATFAFTVSKTCAVTLQVVRTDFNRLVRTIAVPSVPAGAATITWDGRDDKGIFVDSGSYRLALQVKDANGNSSLVRYGLVKVAY